MRLRLIILVLSLLAFLSASTGGYFYYDSLKEAAFNEAEKQAVTRIALIKKNLSSYLSENIKAVQSNGGIHCEGILEGFQPVASAGHDIEKTLDGADII